MKTMSTANRYERELRVMFRYEEYSVREVRPYQDKQQLVGSGT